MSLLRYLPSLRALVGGCLGKCAEAGRDDGLSIEGGRQSLDARDEAGVADELIEDGGGEGSRHAWVVGLAEGLHRDHGGDLALRHDVVQAVQDAGLQVDGLKWGECGMNTTREALINLVCRELRGALEASDSAAPITVGDVVADAGLWDSTSEVEAR